MVIRGRSIARAEEYKRIRIHTQKYEDNNSFSRYGVWQLLSTLGSEKMIEVDYGTTKTKAPDIAISKATLKLFIFNGMASLSEGYHISIRYLPIFGKPYELHQENK